MAATAGIVAGLVLLGLVRSQWGTTGEIVAFAVFWGIAIVVLIIVNVPELRRADG